MNIIFFLCGKKRMIIGAVGKWIGSPLWGLAEIIRNQASSGTRSCRDSHQRRIESIPDNDQRLRQLGSIRSSLIGPSQKYWPRWLHVLWARIPIHLYWIEVPPTESLGSRRLEFLHWRTFYMFILLIYSKNLRTCLFFFSWISKGIFCHLKMKILRLINFRYFTSN